MASTAKESSGQGHRAPIPVPPASVLDHWTLPNFGEEFDEKRALEVVDANIPVSKERLKGLILELSPKG